jgi:hypothetical protein
VTTLAADQFTRADANPIGAGWTTITSHQAFQIVSNAATPNSVASDAGSWKTGTFSNDQYVQAKLFVVGTGTGGNGPGLAARVASGANTYYRLAANHQATTQNLQLGKFVAGTFTSIWQRLAAFTDGALFRLEVRGTTLRVFINGVQVGADATDASIAAGNPGMAYSSSCTSASIDHFEAGDFGTNLIDPYHASLNRSYLW